MRLIRYNEERKESRAKRDLTFIRGNIDIIMKYVARKLRSNLIMEIRVKEKDTFQQIASLKNVL